MLDADELLLLLWEDDDEAAEYTVAEDEPTAWWDVVNNTIVRRYSAWPIYKTPSEVLYCGLELSDVIGSGTITEATVVYASGHGMSVGAAVVLASDTGVAITLSSGRRNTRHVLLVSANTSDGQKIHIDCPVQVTS